MEWKVSIPHGRWMAGVHTFETKMAAAKFILGWQNAEARSGFTTPDFIQCGKRFVADI